MRSIEDYMRAEREECEGRDRCALTVTLLASGTFRARLSFQAGMESAIGEGATVSDAIERLEDELS